MLILVVLYMMQGVPLGLTMGAMCAPHFPPTPHTSLLHAALCTGCALSCACARRIRRELRLARPEALSPVWLQARSTVAPCRRRARRERVAEAARGLRRPFLLQARASYTAIGVFSVASYPYSFKLLWSPVVDSVYSLAFGRRKSWVVRA